MGWWDDITGGVTSLYDQYKSQVAPAVLDTAEGALRQVVPGFAPLADAFFTPDDYAAAPPQDLGGASGAWDDSMWQGPISGGPAGGSVDFPIMTTVGRRLVPFAGAQSWPGPGYHVAARRATRGSAARPAGFYWVPRRSMNPLNPHALRRAIRRLDSASRVARKLFTFKKSGFHGVKPRCRRRRKK